MSMAINIMDGASNGNDGVDAKAPAIIHHNVRLAAYDLVTMATIPGAVIALARLNIFEALARATTTPHLSIPELAALALPGKRIDLTYLGRLLRLMAAKKILREVVTVDKNNTVTERRYSLEPLGRLLVDNSKKGSLLHMLYVQQFSEFHQAMDHLHETVLDETIQPFARAHGIPAWEYFKQHPERGVVVNEAMVGFSKLCMPDLLDVYRGFDDVHVLVDVGGGFGASLGLITARHPHISGINFDQPQVIAAAPQLPGVVHVGGNMFESIPSGGDAIFMKAILHSWEDKRCLTILKNCYQALPAHGKVISVEFTVPEILDTEEGDSVALQNDIYMMTWTDAGGRERTERHMRELGLAAGFKEVHVICKLDTLAVLEFRKP
ncbi:hypothetical protein M758_9G036500 [Ceratodon purpureus]|uniref:Uncharacterized protein n=1 Tax=Ceratodon purpureus TaxID=3225 RepID=A0A8T0GSC0_CERPU|nr:hypothetical protein KC19_9G033600 [Ceratodon purpureus]KAG0561055.1 hypothetical protein KC19_9G033600 [Ceratodon purpureus]KAG0605162.1 hypothetical protein M758_9G036500 [Ceratodon purpureus]